MKSIIKISFTAILIISIFISCKKTPQEIYLEAVESYIENQDEKSKDVILKDLFQRIAYFQTDSYTRTRYINFESCVYDAASKTIILSTRETVPNISDVKFASFNSQTNVLFYSDGHVANIIDLTENRIIFEGRMTTEDNITVEQIALTDNYGIYFYRRNLYLIDIEKPEIRQILSSTAFSPPFRDNKFIVRMTNYGDIGAFVVGNAGKYNLSIVNYSKESSLVANIPVASSRIRFYNNELYHVRFSNKQWHLMVYDISTKNLSTIKSFSSLRDIVFSGDYIYIVDKDSHTRYNIITKESFKLLEDFELEDVFADSLVKSYNNRYYFFKTNDFYNAIADLNLTIPGFIATDRIE